MTQPTPANPFPVPWPTGPRTTTPVVPSQQLVIPVTFKECCGAVLVDEDCDCVEFISGLSDNAPIVLPTHAPGLKALTDPALRGAA